MGQVADNDNLCLAASGLDCLCGIILAVGAREYRNQRLWSCNFHSRSKFCRLSIGNCINHSVRLFKVTRVHRLQLFLIKIENIEHVYENILFGNYEI